MSFDEGVLFIATGRAFLLEAINSVNASRPFLSGRPVAVVTDCVADALASKCFDKVICHSQPRYSYRDKISPLSHLPWKKTLFLDSDARLSFDCAGLFDSIGNSHIAACFAPVRHPSGWNDSDIPSLYPEFNSGVLLFRRSFRQKMLVRSWLRLYDHLFTNFAQSWDQASLRTVVWRMQRQVGLRLCVLPPEANLRTTKPWIAGKGLPVYVVHGRFPENEWVPLLEYLNVDYNQFRSWREWLDINPQSMIRPKLPPDPLSF